MNSDVRELCDYLSRPNARTDHAQRELIVLENQLRCLMAENVRLRRLRAKSLACGRHFMRTQAWHI